MKIEYTLEPISEVAFDNIPGMSESMIIDDVEIVFELNENQKLVNLKASLFGLPMKWERSDLIDPSYPETKDKIYRVLKYLVDRIELQVKIKSFDLSKFNDIKINVTPESSEEIENWSKFRKRIQTSLVMSYSILGAADTTDFESKYIHSQAFSNYTDALNSTDSISKYVSFYKVIESFYPTKGATLDNDIANFMQQFESEYVPNNFQQLRVLRNRCIHPHHNHGHIASSDLVLLEDLEAKTQDVQKIAELLLK